VVLETDERGRHEVDDVHVDDHVADEPALAGFGVHVDQADARKALALGGLVVVAQQLVAATHRQHDGA